MCSPQQHLYASKHSCTKHTLLRQRNPTLSHAENNTEYSYLCSFHVPLPRPHILLTRTKVCSAADLLRNSWGGGLPQFMNLGWLPCTYGPPAWLLASRAMVFCSGIMCMGSMAMAAVVCSWGQRTRRTTESRQAAAGTSSTCPCPCRARPESVASAVVHRAVPSNEIIRFASNPPDLACSPGLYRETMRFII